MKQINSAILLPFRYLFLSFAFSALSVGAASHPFYEPAFLLSLASPNQSYLMGEPIPMDLELTNSGSRLVRWSGVLDFSPDIVFFVQKLGVGSERSVPGADAGFFERTGGISILRATERKLVKRMIPEEFTQRLFPTAGTYQLRMEFSYREISEGDLQIKTIRSNPIQLRVDEPIAIDRTAYQYLTTVVLPTARRGSRNDTLEVRRIFSDSFFNSVYAKYNSYYLAKLYQQEGRYLEAEAEFYTISDTAFFYSEEVTSELRELGRLLGRTSTRTKRVTLPSNQPIHQIVTPQMVPLVIPPIPSPRAIPIPTPAVVL